MPRQNRVTPFGDIAAVPARGTLMGFRGCLHDAECQRGRFNEFMRCWGEANRELWKGEKLRAPVVDAVLQRERMGKEGERSKRIRIAHRSVLCRK